MKTILLIGLITGLSFNPDESGRANVQKLSGVEIYVYSEPTRDYDIIDTGKVMITLTGTCNDRIKTAAEQKKN